MHHRTGNIGHSMTTTVLLQQVEQGTVSLDDKLSEYLLDVRGADQVTLDELAHSTTGYPHYPSDPEFQSRFYTDLFADFPVDDLVGYATKEGFQFEPGTSWQFSDTNILLLGLALEKATGKSMDELVREGILDLLGMDDTTSYLTPDLGPPVLHSYTDERGPWEEGTYWNPPGSSGSGAGARTRTTSARSSRRSAPGPWCRPKVRELQLAPVNVGLGTNTDARYYAMGISIVNDWLLTAPGMQGLHASIGYLPEQKLTVVIYFTRTPE